jgi:branched-chain amino acid transport system ATP-binding protein
MTKLGVARSFQIPQLFRTLSVRENLVLAIGIWDGRHGGARQELRSAQRVARSEDMARLYGIEAYCDRVVASVPQGVRKLLDIAMAGVGEHKVLFLDEPTSGVSVEERDPLMRTVVANAGRSGTTLLIVEHDMDVIRRFVHRVIAFYQGEIICDAPTEQALKDEGVLKYILGRGPLEPARRQ